MAVDCDSKRGTDLFHPQVAETAEALDQNSGRHAFEGVEVDGGSTRDRIFAGLQHDFTLEVADGRGARSDQRASKSRDRDVSGEDHDGSPTDCRGGRTTRVRHAQEPGSRRSSCATERREVSPLICFVERVVVVRGIRESISAARLARTSAVRARGRAHRGCPRMGSAEGRARDLIELDRDHRRAPRRLRGGDGPSPGCRSAASSTTAAFPGGTDRRTADRSRLPRRPGCARPEARRTGRWHHAPGSTAPERRSRRVRCRRCPSRSARARGGAVAPSG